VSTDETQVRPGQVRTRTEIRQARKVRRAAERNRQAAAGTPAVHYPMLARVVTRPGGFAPTLVGFSCVHCGELYTVAGRPSVPGSKAHARRRDAEFLIGETAARRVFDLYRKTAKAVRARPELLDRVG